MAARTRGNPGKYTKFQRAWVHKLAVERTEDGRLRYTLRDIERETKIPLTSVRRILSKPLPEDPGLPAPQEGQN